jgi:outer membrane protein assembly factor BamB
MKFLCLLLLFSCSAFKPKKVNVNNGKQLKMLWARELNRNFESGNVPVALVSPQISEDYLYVGEANGKFRSYDIESGRLMWKFDDKKPLGSQPVRFKDQIIYGSASGRLFSRHHLTGELKYVIDLGQPIETSPLVHKGRVFLHMRNHTLMSLDAGTGKILWRYKRAVPFTTTLQRAAPPIAVESKIIVGFADGHLAAFSMNDGVLRWETQLGRGPKFIDVDVKPLYYRGKLWVGPAVGPLSIINPNNGLVQRSVDIPVAADPIVYQSEVFVGGADGTIYVLNQNGTIQRTKNVSAKGVSSIAGHKNRLVVATYEGDIKLLDSKSLITFDTFNLGTETSAVFGNILSYDDLFAFVTSRSRLYVFKI